MDDFWEGVGQPAETDFWEGLAERPLEKTTEQLKAEHASNLAAGRLPEKQNMVGGLAPVVRAGSAMIGSTPGVGALAQGAGEIVAQGLEKVAGQILAWGNS